MAQEPIHKFGKYEIIKELGRGAMGVVYKARDPLIGRMVALKTVMPGLLADKDLLKRFYREAQSAGRLQHPNIVIIHDLGDDNGLPYIAMEMVEGESLQKIIARSEPLPLARKLRIMGQVCNGLGYAHQRGVVHRDVKPANILVMPDGTVKIVDFGIVHLADTGMTASGMVLGTVSYMSPEQIRGEQVDARSDIFSVGIVMYELLSGRKPFDGPNITAIMLKIASEEPPPIAGLVPGMPPAVEDLVRKCLRKDREDRFQRLEDLALELEPLTRKLQKEVIDVMVREGSEFLAQGEFARAEEVLRGALGLDSGHDVAKSLMVQAQAALKRIKDSAKVQQCFESGRHLLEESRYSEAAQAFEEVLKLDSQHGQARELLQQARDAMARDAEVRRRVLAAKRALAEGDLTGAEAELGKAVEAGGERSEITSLLDKVRQERAAQERRLRLREGISGARDLLRQERYDEALGQLQALRSEFPGDAEVEQLIATAQQKLDERRQVQQAFDEVKALLEQQRFMEARGRAETVRFQFPKDSEATRLYDYVKAESTLAERRQLLELEVTALQEEVKARQYDAALARGERLQREFPGSVEVARLVLLARSEKQAAEREEQVEAVRRSIQALWDAGKLEEAEREAESALEKHPDAPSLRRMLSAIRDHAERRRPDSREAVGLEAGSATSAFRGTSATSDLTKGSETAGIAEHGSVSQPERVDSTVAPVLEPPQPDELGLSRVKVSANVQQYLESGRRLLEASRYREAAQAFEEVLKLDSQREQARDLLQQARDALPRRKVILSASVVMACVILSVLVYFHRHKPGGGQNGPIATQQGPAGSGSRSSSVAPTGAITGRVTGADGNVLVGVTVTVTNASGEDSSADAISGTDGSFRFDKLKPGDYVLNARAPDGYTAPPEAKVQLSGAQEQDVNFSLPKLAAGPASQLATKPVAASSGIKPHASPKTGQGQTQPTTASPTGVGELDVDSNEAGAKIIVDGHDSGEVTPHKFPSLPAGEHTVAAVKEGYETALERVTVPSAGSVAANLRLSRPVGELEFNTTPPGWQISIDGVSYGQTPIKKTLPSGIHKYKLVLGGRVVEGDVRVLPSGFTKKEVTMPP